MRIHLLACLAATAVGLTSCTHSTASKTEALGSSTSQALSTCSAGSQLLDATTTSSPVAVSRQPGMLDVFYAGDGTKSVRRRELQGDHQTWSPEDDAGGALFGKPAVAAGGAHQPGVNRLDLFVRGVDNGLWYRPWTGAWDPGYHWEGGTLTSSPAASSWGPGRVDVFYLGTDKALRWRWSDTSTAQVGFAAEQNLGGTLIGDPAAVSWGPGRIDVFARGTNSLLYHGWYDGSWHLWDGGWGSTMSSAPTVASWAPGRLDVFFLSDPSGSGNPSLKHHALGVNGWEDEEDLGTAAASGDPTSSTDSGTLTYAGDPAAAAIGDNRVDVFVNDQNGHLLRRSWYGQAKLAPADCTPSTATQLPGKWTGYMYLEDSAFVASNGGLAAPKTRIPITALAADQTTTPANAAAGLSSSPWVMLMDPTSAVTPSGKVLVSPASGFSSYTDEWFSAAPHQPDDGLGDTGSLHARIYADTDNPPAIVAGNLIGRFKVDVPVITQYDFRGPAVTIATQKWSFVLERTGELAAAHACGSCATGESCDARIGLCVTGNAGQSGNDAVLGTIAHKLTDAWPGAVDAAVDHAAQGGANPWNVDAIGSPNNRVPDFYSSLDQQRRVDLLYSYVVDRVRLYNANKANLAYQICQRDFTLDRVQSTFTDNFSGGFSGLEPVLKTTPYAGGCTPQNPTNQGFSGNLCDAIYNSRAIFDDTGSTCTYFPPHYRQPSWKAWSIPCVDGDPNDPVSRTVDDGETVDFNCSSMHSTIDAWNSTTTTYATFLQNCEETEVDLQVWAWPAPKSHRRVYLCDISPALLGNMVTPGRSRWGDGNNWEWLGCWDPNKSSSSTTLFDSHSFGRHMVFGFVGDPTLLPVSNDASCDNSPSRPYPPYTFPLFAQQDLNSLNTRADQTNARVLLDSCASDLTVPIPTSAADVKTLFDTTKNQCISAPRFFTSLRDAGGASNLSMFNRLVQQWLAMHSFIALQGAQGAEVLTALADDTTGVAPAGPLEQLSKLQSQLDDGLDLLFDPSVAQHLVAGANAGDYRHPNNPQTFGTGDQGVSLAINIAETATSYLHVVDQQVGRVSEDTSGKCGAPAAATEMLQAQQRVGRSLRYAAALEAIASTIAAATDANHLDATRWDHARRELAAERQRVIDKTVDLSNCRPPVGVENDDVPIVFTDPANASARFFMSSDYFIGSQASPGIAKVQIDAAAADLQAARDAWLNARNSHIQALQQGYSQQQRVEDLESHYAQPIIDTCGLTNINPKDVLAAFDTRTGTLKPESCYVPPGVACASDSDARCYRGTMGEAALAIVAAAEDVKIAQQAANDAQTNYMNQYDFCLTNDGNLRKNDTLTAAHKKTLKDLQNQKMWADSVGAILDVAKDCAKPFDTVLSFGGACGTSLAAGVAKVASINIQKNIEDENTDYAAEEAEFQSEQTSLACWHEADMKKIGIDTAREQIKQRLIETQANLLKFTNAQNNVRELVMEGRAAVARENARTAPSVEFHYWLNEKVDTFRQQFAWAKHVTFLGLKAAEYDYQQSLSLRDDVLKATTPAQLQSAYQEILGVTYGRAINGQSPSGTTTTAPSRILSMVSDILKLEDRTAKSGKDPIGRFQDLLSSDTTKLFDSNGKYLGRAIPFTLDERFTASDRCAERIWRAMAAYVGSGVTSDGGPIGMRVFKRNTFSSRWCAGKGAAGTDQIGSTRPLDYFFAGHGGTLPAVEDKWVAASLRAVNSPSKADFSSDSYLQGASLELSGRGLFGDYMLFIPDSEMQRVNVTALEDIYLRLDYQDVNNLQPGN